jgi:hypothetical protein
MPICHATAKKFFIYKGTPNPNGNTIDELRPISATSYLFKLLEIIIKNRIDGGMSNRRIKSLHQA